MKSVLVNHSDLIGGAAIAAYRTHKALRHVGVDSSMWVDRKTSDDWTVKSPASLWSRLMVQLRGPLGRALPELFFNDELDNYRSYNWIPSRLHRKLNASDADLVHLEWINNETMSIADLSKIRKPKIMTLHDMWLFCGGEHYSEDDRYKTGYTKSTRPGTLNRVDIDRWIWRRKQRVWQHPFQLVAVSEWLAECVRNSRLLADWPVEVIPNPVDTTIWKPLDRHVARAAFNLPVDKKIVLFGATGGTSFERKGYRYLQDALSTIAQERDDIHLVIYGQGKPENPPPSPFPVSYAGRLSDPLTMCLLNNAADVFVTPAMQEAFGQTASEAQACGTPVVAFAKTGIADIVEHKRTGYLAPLGDAKQLAQGLLWVMNRNTDSSCGISIDEIRENCRNRALAEFSYEFVGMRYKELYSAVLENNVS